MQLRQLKKKTPKNVHKVMYIWESTNKGREERERSLNVNYYLKKH